MAQRLYEPEEITSLCRFGKGDRMRLQTRQLSLLAQPAVLRGDDDDPVASVSHPQRFRQNPNALATPGHGGFGVYNE